MKHFSRNFACLFLLLPFIGQAGGDIVEASSTPSTSGIEFVTEVSPHEGGSGLRYVTPDWEFGLGGSVSFDRVKGDNTGDDSNSVRLGVFVGKRMSMAEKFSVNFGLSYGRVFDSDKDEDLKDPQEFGFYVAHDYQATDKVSISARVSVLRKVDDGDSDGVNTWGVFDDATVGIGYLIS